MTPIDKRFVATWPECKGEGIYDDVGPSRPTNCPDDNDKLLISSSNGMVKWIGPIFVQLAFAIYNPLLYTYSCRFLKDEQKRAVHWTWMKSIDSSKPLGGGKKFFLESEAIKINETDFKDKNSPNAIKMRQIVKALQHARIKCPSSQYCDVIRLYHLNFIESWNCGSAMFFPCWMNEKLKLNCPFCCYSFDYIPFNLTQQRWWLVASP